MSWIFIEQNLFDKWLERCIAGAEKCEVVNRLLITF